MKKGWYLALVALAMVMASAPRASAIPFTECPAMGVDTSCAVQFTRNADGSFVTATDSTQHVYDGTEDTLFGVVNNGVGSLFSIVLNGSVGSGIFAFEPGASSDGGCTFVACVGGDSTGYGGFVSATGVPMLGVARNNVTFSSISASQDTGTVNFTGGIPFGGTAWFTLEGNVALTGPPTIGAVPEPASMVLLGTGLLGLARRRFRQNRV